MSVCHLIFEEPQDSFVCTLCGKIESGEITVAQDSVDHHVSLYCETCALDIGPREIAGARTITDSDQKECLLLQGITCENIHTKCAKCSRDPMLITRKDWAKIAEE